MEEAISNLKITLLDHLEGVHSEERLLQLANIGERMDFKFGNLLTYRHELEKPAVDQPETKLEHVDHSG